MPLYGEKKDEPTYEILRSLSGGSVSEVREVHHKVLDRRCVQKTYSTVGLEDAAAYQEPRLLHAIKHSHVVEVLDAQPDPEIARAITFVAIFYEGGSILDALTEGPSFSIHQALKLIVQILDALAHVHTDPQLRYIHRDVKPANILLDRARQNAFLGDWGSAARIEPDGTVAGIEGTPLYTPPEAGVWDGRMGVTGDIYSAGLTAFEMLNGRFDYAKINPLKVDRRLLSGLRALPESEFAFAPHIPDSVRSIIRKAIRPSAAERIPTASEFIAALARVQCVDWVQVAGKGLDGTWFGTWPPVLSQRSRRRYTVRSYVLRAGSDKGKRRLEARQALPPLRKFARFGISDVTVDPEDLRAVERFFAAVSAKAAQRSPAH